MKGRGTRSQSETLGVVLLLGITLLSVGALATFGSGAIDGTQHSVDVQSAEHALSQLDSKVSLVALSEADRQSVALGRGRQGTYTVHPDEGHITVKHLNYSMDEDEHVLYEDTLGEVRYETGSTTLAYQGGGVWRSESSGGSTMVSTPEFHYRGMTLTLPIIRVDGEGSVSGSAQANVYTDSTPISIYPDHDEPYPDDSRNYTNPVQNGTVQIAVQSDYYRAWAEYFESRTDGEVSIDDENETAIVELVSTGAYGDFDMPMDGQPVELRAVGDEHPLTNFTVTIAPDQPDSEEFAGLSWSMWAESGNKEFEISLGTTGDGSCDTDVRASIYYYNGSEEQGWTAPDAFEVTCNDDDEARIHANLTSDTQVTYQDQGSNNLTKYNGNNDFADSVTFDEHEVDNTTTFEEGDTAELGYVVNHYVGLMGPNVDLNVMDGESGGKSKNAAGNVNEDVSSGYLEMDGTGQYVTYLHVSENNVTVDVE